MASVDDKLSKLIEDVSAIKVLTAQHSESLRDLDEKLQPIFDHVTGVKTVVKIGAGVIGIISCLAAVLLLFKS